MAFCPKETDKGYIKLKELLGEDGAFRMTYKMVEKEGVSKDDVYEEALARINPENFTLSERKGILLSKKEDSVDETEYHIGGKDFLRVSRQLDKDKRTSYDFAPAGNEYADNGTVIHSLGENISQDISDENIKAFIEDNNIPEEIVPYFKSFFNKIRKDGMVVSESLLVDATNDDVPLAGRADIIVLRFDGGIDLYDFKTVTWTKTKRDAALRNPEFKIWDPTYVGNNYKARRYTTQLEYYARMIENTLGIPVKNKFIVPIELQFEGDNAKNKMISAKFFNGTKDGGAENVETYGYTEEAKEMVGAFYKDISKDIKYPDLLSNDTSSDFINQISNTVENTTVGIEKNTDLYERRTVGGRKGYYAGNKFYPFENQTDKEAQRQQIIREYIVPVETSKKNIEMTIVNYLKRGDTTFFNQIPYASRDLQTVLKSFLNKPGYQIYEANKIPGFKDKLNWIIIENPQTKTFNLLYIGNEKLNEGMNNRSASKPLLGKAIDWLDNILHFRSGLTNKYRSAKQLEAAMIAMKLKEAKPEYGFDIVGLYSINETAPGFHLVSLKETFKILKGMNTHPQTKHLIPEQYKKMMDDKVLGNSSNYNQDFASMLMYHIDTQNEHTKEQLKLKDEVNSYIKDNAYKDKLLNYVRNELNKRNILKENIDTNPEDAYELRLLSGMLFQLENIDIDLSPIGSYDNYGRVPGNIANETINRVQDILHTSVNRLSREYMDNYKTPFIKVQDALFSERSVTDVARDLTLGDTERYYKELMKRREVDAFDEDGNLVGKKLITTFEFVDEGSAEFNSLSEKQRKMIVFVNDSIEKITKAAKIEWRRGMLPLVNADFSSVLLNAMKTGDKAAYKNAIDKMMESFEETFGLDENPGETGLRNFLLSQSATGRSNDSRLEKMGLSVSNNALRLEEYNRWNQNLEIMMDVFMVQGLKSKHFQDIAADIKAMNLIFRWSQSNLMQDRLKWNIDYTNWQYETMVNNRDMDTGTIKNKVVRSASKSLAIATLGLSPKTALMQSVGMSLSMYSRAIVNTIMKNGEFGIGSTIKGVATVKAALLTKGGMISGKNYDKINKLLERFRFFDQDLSSMLNGLHRNGDTSLFTSKKFFAMMRAADWNARANYMVSQMIEDGTWEAYDLNEDGELEYNELKDQRFRTLPPEKAKALKNYLIANQEDDSGLIEEAYSHSMLNSMRFKANMLYGGMDREVRVGGNYVAEGKMFLGMKNWVPSKLDTYAMSKQDSNLFYGKLRYEKDAKGETYAVWTGEPIEGRFFSLLAGAKYTFDFARKKERVPLTQIQKQNLLSIVSDLTMAGAAMLAAGLLFPGDDDDESILDEYGRKVLVMATSDLLVVYEIAKLDPFYWTPVTLAYANKQIENIISVATGESDVSRLYNSAPFSGQYKQFRDILDNEN